MKKFRGLRSKKIEYEPKLNTPERENTAPVTQAVILQEPYYIRN